MNIIDRTNFTSQFTHNFSGIPIVSRYGSSRSLSGVDSIVLHQTDFDRGSFEQAYDRVIAHYVILRDGRILQLRELDVLLNNAYGRRGISIEMVGDFPNEDGNFGTQIPSSEQIYAARELLTFLKAEATTFGAAITHIIGHVQVTQLSRGHCPGPHIWYNVGYWAKENLGLSSALASALSIPADWEDSRFEIAVPPPSVEWECWLRKPSRATYAKIYAGGVIGVYHSQFDADLEKETDVSWRQPWGWECWVRKTTRAIRVGVYNSGIIAVYDEQVAAETEKQVGSGHIWRKERPPIFTP